MLNFRIIKRYTDFTLDCEAVFEPGITAIFGPSGSGKTTLLNCVSGLVSPDHGRISIGGETVYDGGTGKNTPPERRRLGYVLQDASLFPHMSIWDNILYGYNLTPKERRAIDPEQLLELFQLTRLRDRNISGLSGGERQRVALARALACSPKLLLLDEPLSSLDVKFRGTILRYLKSVWSQLEVPMVYVSHSVSEVLSLSQEVLVLREGEAVVQGKPHQILTHPDVDSLAEYETLENILEATVVSKSPPILRIGNSEISVPELHPDSGDTTTVSIRAGDVILALDVPSRISARNILAGTVNEVHTRGSRILVYIDIGVQLVVEITPQALQDLCLRKGDPVHMIIKSNSILMMG